MNAHRMSHVMMACLALLVLVTSGCGRVREAAARAKKSNDLKQIGLAYHNYLDLNVGKAPANADDLIKAAGGDQQAVQAIQMAKSGQFVILWGSTLAEMRKSPSGASGTILGYEKDAPASGGLVLMGDGAVKMMTAAEFQSAPKGQGK